MKSKLIKQIQQIKGVTSIIPYHVEPEESNELFCIVTFEPDELSNQISYEEIQLRNYNATVKRGLINDETTVYNFNHKLLEEVTELIQTCKYDNSFDASELADISLVCDAMALHYAIDLQAEKQKKMIFNETRP